MFHKITAAIDGSPTSIKALDEAAHIAAQDKAELHIITAIVPLPLFLAGATSSPVNEVHISTQTQYYQKLHHTQEHRLHQTYPDLKITTTIKEGRAATVIKEAATDSDLIVIGHRGQSGIETHILGSVAKELLDQCTSPVLIIKDPTCQP